MSDRPRGPYRSQLALIVPNLGAPVRGARARSLRRRRHDAARAVGGDPARVSGAPPPALIFPRVARRANSTPSRRARRPRPVSSDDRRVRRPLRVHPDAPSSPRLPPPSPARGLRARAHGAARAWVAAPRSSAPPRRPSSIRTPPVLTCTSASSPSSATLPAARSSPSATGAPTRPRASGVPVPPRQVHRGLRAVRRPRARRRPTRRSRRARLRRRERAAQDGSPPNALPRVRQTRRRVRRRRPLDVNVDLLSRAEAASMAEDFGVVPALVSPRRGVGVSRGGSSRGGRGGGRQSRGTAGLSRVRRVHREPRHLGVSSPAERRAERFLRSVAPPREAHGRPRRRRRDASPVRVRGDRHAKTPRADRRERARRRAQRARHEQRDTPTIRRRREERLKKSLARRRRRRARIRRRRVGSRAGGSRGPTSHRARDATRRRGRGRAAVDRIRRAGVGLRDDPSGGGAAISRPRDESKSLGAVRVDARCVGVRAWTRGSSRDRSRRG